DGANAQLGLDGCADLSDDAYIEWGSELPRNLVGDRNASTRKPQNDGADIAVVDEGPTKLTPSVGPILEELAGSHTHTPSTSVPPLPFRAGEAPFLPPRDSNEEASWSRILPSSPRELCRPRSWRNVRSNSCELDIA